MEMELLLCFPSVKPLLFYLMFLIHRKFSAYPMKLPSLKSCWCHLPSRLYYCLLVDGMPPRMVWNFDRKPSLLSHHLWPSLFLLPCILWYIPAKSLPPLLLMSAAHPKFPSNTPLPTIAGTLGLDWETEGSPRTTTHQKKSNDIKIKYLAQHVAPLGFPAQGKQGRPSSADTCVTFPAILSWLMF